MLGWFVGDSRYGSPSQASGADGAMKTIVIFSVLACGFITSSCRNESMMVDEEAFRSSISRSPAGSASVAYETEVLPIFQKACSSCHNGSNSLPNWLSYEVAFTGRDKIYQRVVVVKDMPMAGSLSDEERALIGEWVNAGAPRTKTQENSGGTASPAAPSTSPSSTPSQSPDVSSAPPATSTDQQITYDDVVRPQVFEKICSLCHNGTNKLPNWLDYNVAYSNKARIYDRVVVRRDMPPSNGSTMTDAERNLVKQWIDAGAPKSVTGTSSADTQTPSEPVSTTSPVQCEQTEKNASVVTSSKLTSRDDGRISSKASRRSDGSVVISLGSKVSFTSGRTTSCDFDDDGKADLVITDGSSGAQIVLGNGVGSP